MIPVIAGIGGAVVGAGFGYGFSIFRRNGKIRAGLDPGL